MGDRDLGKVVDEVSFVVERGKIAEFARASATSDPLHTDLPLALAAGFADLPATLTHTVVTAHARDQRAFVEALGLDIRRVVVGSVTWTYARPLIAGDAVTATRRVQADESRDGKSGRMRLVTLETEFRCDDGSVPVTVREVLIERQA